MESKILREIVNAIARRRKKIDRKIQPSEIESILAELDKRDCNVKVKGERDVFSKEVEARNILEYLKGRLPQEKENLYHYFEVNHQVFSNHEKETNYLDLNAGWITPDKTKIGKKRPILKMTIKYSKSPKK